MTFAASHQERMDRKYRHARHIFDFSRKFFLFGRERAIAALGIEDGDTVLEIGCGTARNIEFMARRHAEARFVGIDISREMLKSAAAKIGRRRLQDRTQLLEGDATRLEALPRLSAELPRILMSYSLSMIPDWRKALGAALARLAPGGRLVIVDFGDFNGWPARLRRAAIQSLARHDAPPCLDLNQVLEQIETRPGFSVSHRWGLGGFYQLAIVERLT